MLESSCDLQSWVLLLCPGQRIIQPCLHGLRGGHLFVKLYALDWHGAAESSVPKHAEPDLPRGHLLLGGLHNNRRPHLHAVPVAHGKPHSDAVELWNPEEHNVRAGDVNVPARNVLLGACHHQHQPGVHPLLWQLLLGWRHALLRRLQ